MAMMKDNAGDGDAAAELASVPEAVQRLEVRRLLPSGAREAAGRAVAGETPVSLVYNGLAYAVMMASPQDLEDFAAGFSFTQQIIGGVEDILDLQLRAAPQGMLAQMRIPEARFERLTAQRRNLVGQTGCGLCGVIELEKALLPLDPITTRPQIAQGAVFHALEAMRGLQTLNAATGAMHGAAFFTHRGSPVLLREDVGRHNALDKLAGAMLRAGADAASGFAVVTSRCSYELVEKAVMMRLPALIAISAPTVLAIERARAANLTLLALARPDSALIFNDPHQLFPDI